MFPFNQLGQSVTRKADLIRTCPKENSYALAERHFLVSSQETFLKMLTRLPSLVLQSLPGFLSYAESLSFPFSCRYWPKPGHAFPDVLGFPYLPLNHPSPFTMQMLAYLQCKKLGILSSIFSFSLLSAVALIYTLPALLFLS